MRTSLWMMGMVAVLCAGLCSPAMGQKNTSAWKESGPELKVYDIKAYFTRTPIYNFARVPGTDEGAMTMDFADAIDEGDGGVALFDDADPDYTGEASEKADRLRGVIERLVKPKEAWESEGGRSIIDFVIGRGLMIVYTTEDAHKQIELLLKHIVPAKKQNVVIDIRVVELDTAALGDGPPAGYVARDDRRKAALSKAVTKTHAATSVTGTDGQVLSSEKGFTTAYVSDVEPVVAADSLSWDPTVSTLSEGLSVQVQAVLSSDANEATLDYRMILARGVGGHEAATQGATSQQVANAAVTLPRLASDMRAGTLTMPLGCPVVIAGGAVPASLLVEDNSKGTVDIYTIATVRLMGGAKQK